MFINLRMLLWGAELHLELTYGFTFWLFAEELGVGLWKNERRTRLGKLIEISLV